MQPDPSWQGPIAFYELMFGTWLSYIILVTIWERLLKSPLHEWQYVLLTCISASFFLINHYLNFAPFYWWLINGCSVLYAVVWYRTGIHGQARSVPWKCAALTLVIPYVVLYVGCELSARLAVNNGIHEFWVLLAAYAGFVGIIFWRRSPARDS